MPFAKDTHYREIEFENDIDFYQYYNLDKLKEVCQSNIGELCSCRVMGILQSVNGRFCLTNLNKPSNTLDYQVQVSMAYLKEPPQSPSKPYPVQIFGMMQWKNRSVVFAKILQVLSVPMALRLQDTLNAVVSIHLAKRDSDLEEEHLNCLNDKVVDLI